MQFSFGKYFFLLIMCHEQEIGAGKVFWWNMVYQYVQQYQLWFYWSSHNFSNLLDIFHQNFSVIPNNRSNTKPTCLKTRKLAMVKLVQDIPAKPIQFITLYWSLII